MRDKEKDMELKTISARDELIGDDGQSSVLRERKLLVVQILPGSG